MATELNRSSSPVQRLALYLALAYAVLIVYASLHPFSGWRETGLSALAFLDADWPHYWTAFDIAANLLAYLPLGVLLTLTMQRTPGQWIPAVTATLLGGFISFGVEAIQTWLPSRVPSNLDLASNTLGALFGALLALWQGKRIFRMTVNLRRQLAPLQHIEVALVLVGLWLLTQLSPETFLFGAGDLRHLLDIPPAVAYAPSSFFAIETGIIVCNCVAIGLIFRALLTTQHAHFGLLLLFFVLALAIRTLGAAILVGPQQALAWLTPGAGLGLLIGGATLSILLLLPSSWRLALAGMALMAGTVLVNITPPNPYSTVAMAAWKQGHFLNFNGLTRLVASLWPFLAIPCLSLLGRRH